MPKQKQKGKPTSIRLLPETEAYLMRCKGKTFTEKFEYLVHFCMTREENLKKLEEEYQARYKIYEEIIEAMRKAAQENVDELTQLLNESKETLEKMGKR